MGFFANWASLTIPRRLSAVVFFLLGVVLLVWSWRFLFGWLMPMTEGLLVPWDTTLTRPPASTWARSLNDFFEVAPGSYAPSAVVVALSALVFLARLVTGKGRALLPWRFALLNALFWVGHIVLLTFAHWLSAMVLLLTGQSHEAAGYLRTLPAIFAVSAAIALLLLAQANLIRIERNAEGAFGLRVRDWRV